jgi:SOS-response transcriptional repressor LexA
LIKIIDKPDFATRLRNLREALGQTQAELAESIGIPRTSLANYEKGTSVPPGDLIYTLKLTLNMNVDWFLTGEGDIFLSPEKEKHPLIVNLEAMMDQRLEKFEAQLAEQRGQIAELEAQLRQKGGKDPGFTLITSDPEPEYSEELENVASVGGIAAGKPIFQSEARSIVPVPKRYTRGKPEDYFVGRIMGTSMTNAGIPDGCQALFCVSNVPRHGAIQVVEWAGEATLKRMREVPGWGWKLCFDDGTGRYIEVGPGEEPQIQGDFVAVLREDLAETTHGA